MGVKSSVYDYLVTVNIAVAAKTNGTINGANIDRSQYEGIDVLFVTQALTDGTHTAKLQEADDVAGAPGVFSDVPASQLVLPTSAAGVNGVAAVANTVKRIGYANTTKRWVRPVLTTSGATTGAVAGILVLQHDGRSQPVSNP